MIEEWVIDQHNPLKDESRIIGSPGTADTVARIPTNDRRAALKRRINVLPEQEVIEEKTVQRGA